MFTSHRFPLIAQFCFLLLLVFACRSPSSEQLEKWSRRVGVGDIHRQFNFNQDSPASEYIKTGPLQFSLGGEEFRLYFKDGLELGPLDFTAYRTRGFGSLRAEVLFQGVDHPLEVEVQYGVRLLDPSFSKAIRIRWTGSIGSAPVLERVVMETLPATGATGGGGRGKPYLGKGYYAVHASVMGATRVVGEKVLVEESPGVTLGGGWWSSGEAVIGLSGDVAPQYAFQWWLAHRRGQTPLVLLALGEDDDTTLPAKLGGATMLALRQMKLATVIAHSGLSEEITPNQCLSLDLTGVDDSRLSKCLAQLAMARTTAGAFLFQGLNSPAHPRILLNLLMLMANRHDAPLFCKWGDCQHSPGPLWQIHLAGQDFPPAEDRSSIDLLGRAGAALEPWRVKGEPWSNRLADTLVANLAKGSCALNLGYLPAMGKGRAFLDNTIQWAKARDGLLQNMHRPCLHEQAGGADWVANSRDGQSLMFFRGRETASIMRWLVSARQQDNVVRVYPEGAWLKRDGVNCKLKPARGNMVIYHAWKDECEVAAPHWLTGKKR